MAVKPGYKQTEVGVIPEDWEVAIIGALAETSSGTTPSRARAEKYYHNGKIPWVKTLDLNNSEVRVTDELVTEAAVNESSLRCYPSGSVAVAMYGGFNQIGRTGLLRIRATVNQALTVIRPDTRRLLPEYLLRVLNFRVDHWKSVASSSRKDPNITSKDIRDFPLAIPSVAEQEVIAEALSDADALIESLEQLIAKKRQIKQGAMQELLTGKRRLPGFEVKSGYKQTEVGEIPEDWDVSRVGGCLQEPPSYGLNAPATSLDSRLPTYLRITDITDDGRLAESQRVSVRHPASESYLLEKGDIVFARTGASVGKSYLYDPDVGLLVFAGFLIRLRPDPSKLIPKFLRFFAQSRAYWSWVGVNSMRSGQPGINGREYANLPIPLPSTTEEQRAIANILSDMDAETAALETKLSKARQIKQGMMQELLTGRIRLI